MICILKDTKYAQIQHRMIHLDAANYINIGGEDFTVHKLRGACGPLNANKLIR